jgi:hypothetical protein
MNHRVVTRPPRLRHVPGWGYERMHQPLLSTREFLKRLVRSTLFATVLIGVSLLIGAVGYHAFAKLGWIDALLNAAMILTGMGPVDRMESTAGKLFASGYALFSGVMFLTSVGLLLSPVFHRFLHRFHLEMDEERGQ